MLVSVILPVHNGEKYLAEAVGSVFAQTYPDWEICLVDDGSTDGTAGMIRGFGGRVRAVSQPQVGTAAARNAAIGFARGEVLAFLDADDLWLPEKLERQMAVFQAQPEVDIVSGYVQQFHSPELTPEQRIHTPCGEEPVPGVIPSAVAVRAASFHRVGPFNARFRIGEYVDWSSRAQQAGLSTYMLPELVARRRLHLTNKGNQEGAPLQRIAVLKAAIDRRRAAEG